MLYHDGYVFLVDNATPWRLTSCSISSNAPDNLVTDPSLLKGVNTYVLAFWTTYAPTKGTASGGPMDSLQAWTELSDTDRRAMKQKFHEAGIRITFTCFGGLDQPATWTPDMATTLAKDIAAFTMQYELDG